MPNRGYKQKIEHTDKTREKLKGNQNAKGSKATLGKHWKVKNTSKMRHTAWNKGLSINLNPKGSFKKGAIPFNKGKKGIQTAWNKGIPNPSFQKDKNPNWKGGITKNNSQIRQSLEIKLWKKACMERDNFTDQKTGQKGGDLQVHHINNFSSFPELRTSLENGITLSKESHKLFHKIYGTKNNSREQLLEFLKTE